jgi:hypothetical protein
MRDGYKRLTAAICGKAGLTLTLFQQLFSIRSLSTTIHSNIVHTSIL